MIVVLPVQAGPDLSVVVPFGAHSAIEAMEIKRHHHRPVLSLVDNTHPAAAQLLDDAVVRDGLPDH
ncbi:MAG: hypothetical protein WB660_30440 [Candidatus Sulfotelmatobacter sp.]